MKYVVNDGTLCFGFRQDYIELTNDLSYVAIIDIRNKNCFVALELISHTFHLRVLKSTYTIDYGCINCFSLTVLPNKNNDNFARKTVTNVKK